VKDREAGAASAKAALSFGAQPCCPEGPSRSEAEWTPSTGGVEKRRAAKRNRAGVFVVRSQATGVTENRAETTVLTVFERACWHYATRYHRVERDSFPTGGRRERSRLPLDSAGDIQREGHSPRNSSDRVLPNDPASAAIVFSRASARPFSNSKSVLLAIPLCTARCVKLQPRPSRSCLILQPSRACRDCDCPLVIVPILRYSETLRYRYSGMLPREVAFERGTVWWRRSRRMQSPPPRTSLGGWCGSSHVADPWITSVLYAAERVREWSVSQ